MSDIEKKSIKTKGGARPNSGRKKGSPNKVTAEIKEIANQYGEQALLTLVNLMHTANSDSTKVMAAKEILDRAYGKATQYQEVEVDHKGGVDVNIAPKLSKEEWLEAHGLEAKK
jgi:hypothetical protein